MDQNNCSRTIIIFRWIAFLPCAIITAGIVWYLVALINQITMVLSGIDPDSFLFKVFILFISHACMGATFVYVGTKVAPQNNKIIAFILAGIGLVASGFLLFPAIMITDYWAIIGCVSLVLGCVTMACLVYMGNIEI